MRNYIVIRFSLKFDYPSFKKINDYLDGLERSTWFAWRAELMKKTLVPAILNQRSPVHKVFLFMDKNDKDLYEKFLNLGGVFEPVFCKGSELNQTLARLLSAEGSGPMVVSRIDSDDSISVEYTYLINKDFEFSNKISYLVAAKGYISDLLEIQDIYYNCSPFISIYFPEYEPKTLFFKHLEVLDKKPIVNITAEWMQILHGTNVSNKFRTKNIFEVNDKRKMLLGQVRKCIDFWPKGFVQIDSLPNFSQ